MSREDLIAVTVRIFSVFLLVTVARYIPSAIALVGQGSPQPSWVLAGLVLASSFAICAALWFFPLTIARKLLPAMSEPRSETSMSGKVALSVGLTLLGVWVMADAVPETFYWVTIFFLAHQTESQYFHWGHEQIASVVMTMTELALSTWLIFGSSGIKRLILRYRYGPAADVV